MAVPSEREYGALEKEVAEIRHDLRNQRMICNNTANEISELRQELEKLKVRLTTGAAIVMLVVGGGAWIIELVVSR